MESKRQKIKQFITPITWVVIVAIVALGVYFWQKNPAVNQPEQSAQPTEQSLSEDVTAELGEETRNAAISYLELIVQRAYAEGSNAALRQVVSFAQTTKEDGTVEPICQEVTIGDLRLVNVACLKKPETPTFELPN